ncbi:unnamed protein product [Parascedosporium putredinis]|uniref:Secreted protein n=1 Tax=Parascedosporium putredinis TaxID=1442378 RepID=A0A9P1GYC2_9PEZI|nr:unnamed protein product [Parascedosporium putredinis]CAI7990626.1 unnamed protein product [Parascedosporium putredinis]
MWGKGWSEMIKGHFVCCAILPAAGAALAKQREKDGVFKDGGGHAEVALEAASHSYWVAAVERGQAATSGLNDGSTSLKALDKCGVGITNER